MIPQFPRFKLIELSDRTDVEEHTNLFEPYSDFNFNCLWAWDAEKKRMISEFNGNLVVKFTDYRTHELFLSFLGIYDCEGTARTLIDYCTANHISTTLRLMPDVSISGINPKTFTITENRGDFDYILSTKELALLSGDRFKQKRGGVNRFWRENPEATLEPIDASDLKVQQQILEIVHTWEHHKSALGKDYEIAHELAAMKRLFESNRLDSLLCVGLFSGGVMLGYSIAERLPNGYALGHFWKSDISYKGVTEALMQEHAKYLVSLQIMYLNTESDLEVDSMRRSKMSWRPVKFLKRYEVRNAQL